MRMANLDNRAALVVGPVGAERALDIADASKGLLPSHLPSIYEVWEQVVAWAGAVENRSGAESFPVLRSSLGPPSPAPRQVFAVGLNYGEHAAESGFDAPTDLPPIFAKWVSSFSGPDSTVVIPRGGNVDWEVELVAVIGRQARFVEEASGWSHVAGLTLGQDISERISQFRGPAAQFGLGKSFAGFSPQGPWLVTTDEFHDANDLELGCSVDGEEVQRSRTRDLIFSVPKLIAALSATVTLYPGDVIFTGTPAGVGVGREPQRFLKAGQRLDSWVEGIGELHQVFVDEPHDA